MRAALLLLAIIYLWPARASAQDRPILVVGPIQCASRINNPKIRDNVRTALSNNFYTCKNLAVLMQHKYKANTPEEEIIRLREVENIIIQQYILHRGLDPTIEPGKGHVTAFKRSILTRYLVFGYLNHNPVDIRKEYQLELHVVDVDNWTYVMPVDILYFTETEILDHDAAKTRVAAFLAEKVALAERGFCFTRQLEFRLDSLDQDIRLLIRAEWLFPEDTVIRQMVQNYTRKSDRALKHYLDQKLIVFSGLFQAEFEKHGKKPTRLLLQYSKVLVETLDRLIPRTTDLKQLESLRRMYRFYRDFLP
ncbi:MAG: hypothetical protein R3D58_18280 [Saprospiraceae bacterium]|nr:hypothetical protein [Lewinellaceae bacterium]